ncbi:hypothetical protein, partial [Escherichia coli]|uniref:hypothetical protein n=1 Tax=Escherichia coli TaxID=562 RepID=UPI001BA5CADF
GVRMRLVWCGKKNKEEERVESVGGAEIGTDEIFFFKHRISFEMLLPCGGIIKSSQFFII